MTPFLRRCIAIGLAVVVGLVMARPGMAQEGFDHAGLARRTLEDHIRPGYARLSAATATLAQALTQFCDGTSGADRSVVVTAFDGVVTAWGRIEHIDFGPITSDNRRERFYYWPDRRGIGAQQVAKALRSGDETVTDPERLIGKSVALQGLGALEAILFSDPAAHRPGSHACRFSRAVAGAVDRLVKAVVGEWSDPQGFAARWLAPGPGNAVYLKPAETTLALAKAYDRGIERIRDTRIAGPLGFTPQQRKSPPPLLPSGRSMLLVTANIQGIIDLVERGGIGAAIVASDVAGKDVAIRFGMELSVKELRTALAVAEEIRGVKRPFEEAKAKQRMIAMGFPLKNARTQAVALFERAAGLSLGFNASDGD